MDGFSASRAVFFSDDAVCKLMTFHGTDLGLNSDFAGDHRSLSFYVLLALKKF